MAVRNIRVFGDPVLTTVCKPVTEITAEVRAHVQDLLDTVAFDGRAGLASTQIGQTLRIFSLHIDGEISYIINPELTVSGTPEHVGEGCLSVPDLWHRVLRYPYAKVTGINLEGEAVEIAGTGLLAQALQHECDHLDGKLYIHRLDADSRKIAMRQIRAASWF